MVLFAVRSLAEEKKIQAPRAYLYDNMNDRNKEQIKLAPIDPPSPPPTSTNNINKNDVKTDVKTLVTKESKNNVPKKQDSQKAKSENKTKEDKLKKAALVEKLIQIDYNTQNPPRKLYEREGDMNNRHIPPVYFKSYYLSLAFDAVAKDDYNGLNAVLKKYYFINGQNIDGDTILIHAVRNTSVNAARVLLAKGAYVNAVNNRQRSALHYATVLSDVEMVKLLLSMGADFTIADDTGMTALDYMVNINDKEMSDLFDIYVKRNKLKQN